MAAAKAGATMRAALSAPRMPPVGRERPADAADERALAAPREDEFGDRLEHDFAADRSDATPELERQVERGVRSALPAASSLRSLVCRSALCRVETVHPSIGEHRTFAERAFFGYEAAVRAGPIFALKVDEPAAGQSVVAVTFVARVGSTMFGR